MGISRASVAAQIMRHLCTCPKHGYSQPGRFGTSGYCNVSTDAGTIQVKKGDRDCSSAVCEAWELALKGTAYEGRVTRYHYTGDMESVLVGSGLFDRKPMSFNAQPGDIYLDVSGHTAMCIQNDGNADLLGEFSISETGGIDGEPGDQTGRESGIHGYYSGSWDFILHYNGKADSGSASGWSSGGSGNAPSGDVTKIAQDVINGLYGNGDARRAALGSRYAEVQAEVNRLLSGGSASGGGTPSSSAGSLPIPRYRVAIMRDGRKKWLGWCVGLECEGCDDDFAGIEGEAVVDIEIDKASLGDGGWYKKHMSGGVLVALTVYYKTPAPGKTGYYAAKYRVHWMGSSPRWGKWEYDDDDGYAGNMKDAIDMVQIMIERV